MIKKNIIIFLIILFAAVLRLVVLDRYPAGLNADEATIGYNAYSLIQTGKDEHGTSWPLVFRSFDDYKPGVYFYIVLPFIKFLGLNVWAVRLPSALLGIASVYLIYLLVRKLFPDKKYLPDIAALMLAISPWHLHFSRGGWEVNAATLFLLAGTYFFLKAADQPKFYLLFVISFVLSMYTYHSIRLIAPILGFILLIIYRPRLKLLTRPALLGLILLIPLAFQVLSPQGRSRFSGVSIFADEGPLWEALMLRQEHQPVSLPVRLIHSRYATYSLRFAKNYLSHFSPRFLFINGEEIARSKVPEVGQSLIFLFPFFYLGLVFLIKNKSKGGALIFSWLLIAPLAAALTFQSPHALRAQNMTIPLNIIIALGIFESLRFSYQKSKFILLPSALILLTFISYSFVKYLHQYYVHYPKELPYAWQYGFDKIANYVKENYDKYDKIIISDRYDQPYIIMAFYLKYPPKKFQKEIVLEPRDKFGFSTVRRFDKFEFRRINYGEDKKIKNALIVVADEPMSNEYSIYNIHAPGGEAIFRIARTEK